MTFLRYVLLIPVILFLLACGQVADGPVMVASLSSNGQFVLTSHRDKSLVLWNLESKTHNVVSNNTNIYSAYFVKNNDKYIWQDLDKTVHIRSINGEQIKSFTLPYDTYGHVISTDLGTYVSSDNTYAIKLGYGSDAVTLKAGDQGTFSGFGKLLNLQLSKDDKILLSVGYSWSHPDHETYQFSEQRKIEYKELYGPMLWDIVSRRPVSMLPGNAAKTYATFSPDGNTVISGCENGNGLIWNVGTTNVKTELASLFHGIPIDKSKERWEWDKTNLIRAPKSFTNEAIISLKYISGNKFYLRFTTNQPYAILYTIENPLPLKYLELGKIPFPAVSDYDRNAAIDSAPEAGILVTGQRDGNGINVYKFDKENLTLQKIWTTK